MNETKQPGATMPSIASPHHPINIRMMAAGCPERFLAVRLADSPLRPETFANTLALISLFAQGGQAKHLAGSTYIVNGRILFIEGDLEFRGCLGAIAARARLGVTGGSLVYLDGITLGGYYKRADFDEKREIVEGAIDADLLLFDSFASHETDSADLAVQSEIILRRYQEGRPFVVTSKNDIERLALVAKEFGNGLFASAVAALAKVATINFKEGGKS